MIIDSFDDDNKLTFWCLCRTLCVKYVEILVTDNFCYVAETVSVMLCTSMSPFTLIYYAFILLPTIVCGSILCSAY
jgi:hypothetical protein